VAINKIMIKLKIDNTRISVPAGTSVLKAAKSIGIDIPTMCFMEGYHNHPSCMICLVKDRISGRLVPACATKVTEGMDIISEDDELYETRKKALELLMSDHVGDCEAPCRMGCPAFMDIPRMNRLIAAGKFREALVKVKEEIALPFTLGYVCSAPCEKVCRRGQIDSPVSICMLKRFVADMDTKTDFSYLPEKDNKTNKNVAIIGSGPTGLAAAFHLTKKGHRCVVFEKGNKPGGSLVKLSESELPPSAIEAEIKGLKNLGVEFSLSHFVDEKELHENLMKEFDAVLIASGASDDISHNVFGLKYHDTGIIADPETFETHHKGIFACGSIMHKHKMAVRALAHGKSAAAKVDQYLHKHQPEMTLKKFNSKFGKLNPDEFVEYLKESVPGDRIEPSEGWLKGFSEKEAMKEAARCLHCDCRKPDSCKLRLYSDRYHIDRRKFMSGERNNIKKYFNHDLIVYEPEKCIKCGLCIEIVQNEKELTGLAYVGRGFDVRINIPFNNTLSNALTHTALKCAKACPTAAISLKNE